MSFSAISILVALLPAFTIVEGQEQGVFLFGHNFDQYDFSCTAGLLAALSEDRRSILFYDIVKEHFVEEKNLSLPGQLLKWTPDGQRLVITQDSYMTVLYGGELKTTSIWVARASSVVVIEDLACVVPAVRWSYMVCMNLTTFEVKACSSYLLYAGSIPFVNSLKKWAYMLDPVLSSQPMYKFSVADGCLNHTRNNPVVALYNFGNHIWYSYDGSRIFLDNGLTLTASSNPQTDMQVHGDFNSSYAKYQYNWFSQSGKSPYLIAGLRSDLNDTVLYYTWPYLRPSTAKPIPLPKTATRIVRSEQVHTCYENSLFVFATYEMSSGVNESGVAYMTI